ncbi:hypothetical protein [Streptomyces sp. NBC_01320]|uniref:hypothetical protein n=1 Tax=Streptomyces sp. NBC_01320 TaxID=2903824 RepID=UPI002E164271|nr:hypothetical protein OG395_01565 [Streptomyces sp. NBC_01320]WSK00986.1 hypothetical protein OG395_53785 [Streptomyces sp. NBC_01320]
MNWAVPWSEAALVAVACWAVSGLGYGVLAALVVLGAPRLLAGRGRGGPRGGLSCCSLLSTSCVRVWAGTADALATGAAATVALAVFILVDRGAGRGRDHDQDLSRGAP